MNGVQASQFAPSMFNAQERNETIRFRGSFRLQSRIGWATGGDSRSQGSLADDCRNGLTTTDVGCRIRVTDEMGGIVITTGVATAARLTLRSASLGEFAR
jgi:hypothetical protein